jgi:hypothetical protein
MRVLRDVVVNRSNSDELLAIAHSAGIAGEEMSLGLVGAGGSLDLRVRVLESRPVIVDGNVRHRLRLALLPALASVEPSEASVEPSEAAALLDVTTNTGAEAI